MPQIYVTVTVETEDRLKIENIVAQLMVIDGAKRLGDGMGVTFCYMGEKETELLKLISAQNHGIKLLAEFFICGGASKSTYGYVYEDGEETLAGETHSEAKPERGFPPKLIWKVSIAINQLVKWKRFYLEEKDARAVFYKIVKDNHLEDDVYDQWGTLEAVHWSKDGDKCEMSVRVDREFLGTSADGLSDYAQPYALPELFKERNSKFKIWNFVHEDEDGMQYHREDFQYEAPADLDEEEAWECFMDDWESFECEPDLDGVVHWNDGKDRSEFVPV